MIFHLLRNLLLGKEIYYGDHCDSGARISVRRIRKKCGLNYLDGKIMLYQYRPTHISMCMVVFPFKFYNSIPNMHFRSVCSERNT